MDYIRSCYTTHYRLWQGQPDDVRVRWYFAAPGARLFPELNQMYSSVWDDASTERTVGDVGFKHRWSNGKDTLHVPGDHFCGPLEAWENGGILGTTPPIEVDADGSSECCPGLGRSAALEGGGAFSVSAHLGQFGIADLEGGGNTWVNVSTSAKVTAPLSSGGSIDTTTVASIVVDASLSGGGSFAATASGPPSLYALAPLTGGSELTTEGAEEVPMIAEVRWLAYDAVPAGWLACNGQFCNPSTYADLFAAIGYTYGMDPGSSDFAVPPMQRRVLMGDGGSAVVAPSNTIGSIGGEEDHQLTSAESGVPAHTHPPATTGLFLAFNATPNAGQGATGTQTMLASSTTGSNAAASAANSHNNVQPSIVMRPIIYAGV